MGEHHDMGGDDHHEMSGEPSHSHVHARSAASPDTMLVQTWTFEKGNAQHITMYSAFILGAVVEIMLHHGVDIPRKLDYGLGVLAFTIEAFLFGYHLHGKAPVEVVLHVFLVYAIVGCVLMCCLEAYDEKQILFTYGRIVFTLLQGTWFYQVGFMLYPPTDNPAWHWDLNDHGSIMIITVTYCWHVMLIIMGLLLQLWCMKLIYTKASDRLRARLDELIYIDRGNKLALLSNNDYGEQHKAKNGNHVSLFAMNSDDEDANLVNHNDDDN